MITEAPNRNLNVATAQAIEREASLIVRAGQLPQGDNANVRVTDRGARRVRDDAPEPALLGVGIPGPEGQHAQKADNT